MGKSICITIGDKEFPRKGDALEFLKGILNRYRPGDQVSEDDADFLKSAITRHPDANKKIGVGIANFIVRSAEYNTQCFWIIRTDQSEERFSYKSCV